MDRSDNGLTVRYFQRFSRSQRLQHAIQIVSFTVLCVTGLLQKFSDNDTVEGVIGALGGIERMRAIHRVTAIVFILEATYHVGELAWLVVFRRIQLNMLPTLKDAKDASQMMRYFLGFTTVKARFDRFDFKQKVEYLSLIWGSVVMVATGLMMWFPVQVTEWLPGEVIPAARVAHGGEGLLAFLAILVWHMYSAHFSPDVFPFDATIFTGKISEERMKHEHPLEYERIIAAESTRAFNLGEPSPQERDAFEPSDGGGIHGTGEPYGDSTGSWAEPLVLPDEEVVELAEVDYLDEATLR